MTEAFECERVVTGLVDPRVDPWPTAGAHEVQSVLEGSAGDAGVDGGMEDLRQGPTGVGRSKALWNGTTSSSRTGTLSNTTEPLPVVRWPKPLQSSITCRPGLSAGTNTSC